MLDLRLGSCHGLGELVYNSSQSGCSFSPPAIKTDGEKTKQNFLYEKCDGDRFKCKELEMEYGIEV